jgi:D-beta-D-heptose 7-phosphate kinase/D-beta-D-heptose 1-phosphate adenosyltransferase
MLIDLINCFAEKKILVIGDVMLDEYIWGDVNRISPEAPVPVVNVQRESIAPGGACNVAANVASLGGTAYLIGMVGRDLAADLIRQKLLEMGVDVSGLVVDNRRPTITKTRIVARNQQVVRFDREVCSPLEELQLRNILQQVELALPLVSQCIVSDYAKGIASPFFLEKLMEMANSFKVPVLVDPKGNNYSKYRGAALITPNLQEVQIATGIEVNSEQDLLTASNVLRDQLSDINILIKQGKQGMTLFPITGIPLRLPARTRQVFDVTGAGDTVIGTLALAIAAGAPLDDAARLANCAAGVVVGKVGTAILSPEELITELSRD